METRGMASPLLCERLPYVWAGYQTAGRGQQGNSWESEKGQNLTCSILIRDTGLHADEQWRINMMVSVALCQVIDCRLKAEDRKKLTIKWPNDIYFEDRKLAGILIEHTLMGREINYSIVGIGLNVNQVNFLMPPNPVSLKQIIGTDTDLGEVMEMLLSVTQDKIKMLPHEKNLCREYVSRLYRRDGYYPYVEREVNLEPTMNEVAQTANSFDAEIKTITPQGQLVLRLRSGEERTYHFKQIRYVIGQ